MVSKSISIRCHTSTLTIRSEPLTSLHPHLLAPLNQQKPVIREEINVVKNTVVNLTDETLTEEETQLLSLGLKFCPTSESDPVAKTSSKLEPVLKKLGSWYRVSCHS